MLGSFELPVLDRAGYYLPGATGNIDSLTYLQCSLITLYAWASQIEQIFQGAVQMEVDGVPVADADGTPFGTAKYSTSEDRLSIGMYANDSVSISVDAPFLGANTVTSASYYTSNCYYTSATGTVTLVDFGDPSVTTWWTGSFEVDFPEGTSSGEGASCPAHKVTGQFGAAVCM